MKRWLVAWLMGMAWMIGSADAFADSIKVTITKNFGASVKVQGDCHASQTEQKLSSFEVAEPDDAAGDLLRQILAGDVLCSDKHVAPTIEVTDGAAYPYAVQPREYQWSFPSWTWIDQVIARLGPPDLCDAAESGQEVQSDGKSCKAARNSVGIAFELKTPFDRGQIVAKYGGKRVLIAVYPCEFDVVAPIPGIVAGASEQLLDLVVSEKTSSCRLPSRAGTLGDEAGARSIFAQVDEVNGVGQVLKLTDVPGDLPGGIQSFNLRMAGGLIAKIRTNVIPAPTVSGLVVNYHVPEELDAYGHFAAASGDADTSATGVRFAVVSRKVIDQTGPRDAVVNTALLSWPSVLTPSSADAAVQEAHSAAVARIKVLDGKIKKIAEDRKKALDDWQKATAEWKKAMATLKSPTPRSAANAPSPVGVVPDPVAPPAPLPPEYNWADEMKLRAELSREASSVSSYFLWRVAAEDAGAVRILPEPGQAGEFRGDLHRIAFVVDRAVSSSLNAVLVLQKIDAPTGPEAQSSTRNVLKLAVPLAARGRIESIPLPARDLVEVLCNDEKVAFWNGEVHSIGETAVSEGECRVQIKPADASLGHRYKEKWAALQRLLPLYGPQTFSVVVRRGGVESRQLWQFLPTANGVVVAQAAASDPTRQPFWAKSIGLQEPRSETKTDAYYTVEVRPIANQNIAVSYRNSTLAKIADATIAAAGELTFTTRLRSRGLFAIEGGGATRDVDGVYQKPFSIRTYLSASVIASGLRFPAARVDLKSSTSSEDVQYLTPLVGVLWSVEKWDYDKGLDPIPLNPALQAGGHFYTTNKGDIGFNPIIGVAVGLPLVQEETAVGSQLGTKATLGLFFEYDTRDRSPHALLALSVNVGSVLSGK